MNDYSLEYWKSKYPEKFADEDDIFRHIHRGGTIFVSSACAEPQYLLKQMVAYAEAKSRTIFMNGWISGLRSSQRRMLKDSSLGSRNSK